VVVNYQIKETAVVNCWSSILFVNCRGNFGS